ncbi:MAG: hypothetical protein ACFFF4_15475 [Candidatus Thorarchaeota archaeon]
MSAKVPSIASLKPVRDRFADFNLKKHKKILILSAKSPSSVISTAILCRSALRANILFHVKFIDAVSSMQLIRKEKDSNSNSLLMLVGINAYGKKPSQKEPIVDVGSIYHAKLPISDSVEPEFFSPAVAYGFSKAKLKIELDDLALATVGSIIESPSDKIASKLIKTSEKVGIVSAKKGFKIPGTNFIPLNDLFCNSIYPYLDGLSGAPDQCKKLLENTDLPFKKRTGHLSQLTAEEATRLNAVLLPRLSSSAISSILGSGDYELLREKHDSPIRYVATINALGHVAWCRNKMGLFLGVMIGDRARQLDSLKDLYREHCKEVLEGVYKLNEVLNDTEAQIQTGNQYISTAIAIPEAVLSDVGRITLESSIGNENKFLILRTPQSLIVSWTQDIPSLRVFSEMVNMNLAVSSKSYNSVMVADSSEQTHAKIVELMRTILDGA